MVNIPGLSPLSERVFMVTGATAGIGKFTAEQLATQGCTVLVHGRNPRKIDRTVKELQALAPNAKLHGIQGDLSSMADVRRLAADVSERFPVIHGLLNNAGTFNGDYSGQRVITEEGNELSLAVNVLAPFLLSCLLLGTVRASGHGRILVTSSVSQGSGYALDDLQLKRGWSDHKAYSLSKLCVSMMTREMHERYADPPRLCFHTMDPGTVDTKMLRAGWFSGGASVRTATTSFKMLTEDSFQASSGSCVGGWEIEDDGKRAKLWKDLEGLTDAKWPDPQTG
jgi:NAD(P)-dependent dehydrogenase (short-subunit alcohol dehydrogenase family)